VVIAGLGLPFFGHPRSTGLFVVVAGLDPATQMDARIKSGHDTW
jgi:hypothetical protein